MKSHGIIKYAETLVTDKEINNYYKDKVKEDIEVYHILVTPKVTDDMESAEKTKAEENAKTIVNDIIKKLDAASDKLEEFKKLVKEFSEDEATKDKDGNLGYINYGDLSGSYDELLDSAYKIKDGEYSKTIITTELGYHVIYRNASKEKDKLEDIKDEILTTLAEEKANTTENIDVDAMKYYYNLYNLDIIDSALKNQYGLYLNNLRNQSNN